MEDVKNRQDGSNQFLENFLKYKNITEVTREVEAALIDMIYMKALRLYSNIKIHLS